MTNKVLVVLLLLFVVGCHETPHILSNDDIIREAKKCEDAGMDADVVPNRGYERDKIIAVICQPRKKDQSVK